MREMATKERLKTAKKIPKILNKPDVEKKRNVLKAFAQELRLDLLQPKLNLAKNAPNDKVVDTQQISLDPKVVVFQDPTKRRTETRIKTDNITTEEKAAKPKEEKTNVMSLKKARHDVLKFGITGFEKKKKIASKEQMAIRLGAVPRKKPAINYKLFMQMRQEEIVKERQTRELKGKLGLKVKKPERAKRSHDKNAIRGFDGQIGKYKDGFQVISKQDIRRIQQSGKRK